MTLTPSFSHFYYYTLQIQSDKEKLLYELDDLQAQLEKAQLNTNRFQAEREEFHLEAERQRDKNDKLQVSGAFYYFHHIPIFIYLHSY